jgi:hypothetical protein
MSAEPLKGTGEAALVGAPRSRRALPFHAGAAGRTQPDGSRLNIPDQALSERKLAAHIAISRNDKTLGVAVRLWAPEDQEAG